MNHAEHRHHPVIHIVSTADHALDDAGWAAKSFKAIAGSEAFRNYNVTMAMPQLNRDGNLRGMVISTRWRTAFHYSSELGEHLENFGTLISFAANLVEAGHQLETIYRSNESRTLKGLRFAAPAGTAAERTLLGVIPSGAHLIYLSLQGYCKIVGLAGGKYETAANSGIATLKRADAMVHKAFSVVTDTNNQAAAFWYLVELRFLPSRKGAAAKQRGH